MKSLLLIAGIYLSIYAMQAENLGAAMVLALAGGLFIGIYTASLEGRLYEYS